MSAERSFSVSGVRNGSLVSIRWVEGKLDGDPPTVDLIEEEVELALTNREDMLVYDHYLDDLIRKCQSYPLADPAVTYYIVTRVIDTIRECQFSPRSLLELTDANLSDR